MFEVVVLGSGTCSVSLRRNAAGYCLIYNDFTCLLDTSPGAMRQLLRSGVKLSEIDAIFYTHFHVDHISELPFIIFTMKYDPLYHREKPVNIYGSTGLIKIKNGFESIFDGWVNLPEERLIYHELEPKIKNKFEIAGLSVTTMPVKHIPSSIAYRFETPEGKSVVFSGDLVMCDEIIELAKDADLLILECAFPEDQKSLWHLFPSDAGKIARRAGVKKLVLTHFYPQCDESDMITPCKREYDGEVVLAEDFMRFAV